MLMVYFMHFLDFLKMIAVLGLFACGLAMPGLSAILTFVG